MTGVRFLFRVTLRRHDLAAEIYHLKEPQKVPPVMSQDEIRRLLAMAANIKLRVMLSLAVAVSGERSRKAAKRSQLERWLRWEWRPRLRAVMSSIMR